MGLDSVELVMEFEKAFDIRVPDATWERTYTVGDAYNVVWQYLEHKQTGKCTTQVMFYRLRKVFAEHFHLDPKTITPSTLMDDIVPKEGRRAAYASLQQHSGYKLYPLELETAFGDLVAKGYLPTIGGALVFAYYQVKQLHHTAWWWLLPIPVLLLYIVMDKSLYAYRTHFNGMTFGNLVKSAIRYNLKQMPGHGISRREMEGIMNDIIVDKIGVDHSEIAPEKRFTSDLGID